MVEQKRLYSPKPDDWDLLFLMARQREIGSETLTRGIEEIQRIRAINADLLAALEATNNQLGEAIHTAFRKAADSPASNTVWHGINQMPDNDWRRLLDFILDGLGVRDAIAKAKE